MLGYSRGKLHQYENTSYGYALSFKKNIGKTLCLLLITDLFIYTSYILRNLIVES